MSAQCILAALIALVCSGAGKQIAMDFRGTNSKTAYSQGAGH